MAKIYPFYHQPEKYPAYLKRPIRVTTRDTLENTIQFMSLRDLPHPGDGTLLEINEAMDLYTKRYDLGKVFWMRAHLLNAPNIKEFLLAAKERGGYVFDLWGFVPGSYKKGQDCGEYAVTDEQHKPLMGPRGRDLLPLMHCSPRRRRAHRRRFAFCAVKTWHRSRWREYIPAAREQDTPVAF